MVVKEINTEEKIANLEDKISNLREQLKAKKTKAAQKAANKQIKLLEKKLNQFYGFNNFALGDWVCNGQLNLAGQIVELKNQNEFYEIWVLWDGDTTPKPSDPSTLTKQDPDQFIWDWDNDCKAITRKFDRKECDDFKTLLGFIEIYQDAIKKVHVEEEKKLFSEKLSWIHRRWKFLTEDRFRKGDRVKYQEKNATVEEYQYLAALLYVWIKFDEGNSFLASPEDIQPLRISQQILQVEPEETYPCVKEISIASITIDQSLQGRLGLDKATLQEYAEIIEENKDELDPVKVIQDERGNRWLWDGFHTVQAHIQKQKIYIKAAIELGTYDRAFNLSLGANAKRGLKLSQADKRNNVKRAILANLTDDEGKPLSNRAIAQLCCVSHGMVNYVKKELFPPPTEPLPPQNLELIQPEQISPTPETPTIEPPPPLSKDSPEKEETEEPEIESVPQSAIIPQEEIEQLKVVNEEKPENITVYLREDIVYVKDSAIDKRLVGYINRPAMVLENHSHSVDLLFWGDNIIKNISKQDIGLMQQKVNMLARITTKQLAILIQKFNSPEDAIAQFTNTLTANEF